MFRIALSLIATLVLCGCGRTGISDDPRPGGRWPLPQIPPETSEVTWALAFDGVDERVTVPASSAFDLSQITVEAWIFPTDLSNEMHIVSHHDHDANQGWVLLIKDQKLEFRTYNGGARTVGDQATSTITANAWHHVAGTFNGSTSISAWVDGVETDGTGFAPNGTSDYSGPVRIGLAAYTEAFPFAGYIDEVRVSNIERYDNGSYARPTSAFVVDANTISLWHFDEGPDVQALADAGTAGATATRGTASGTDAEDPAWVAVPDFPDR